MYKKYLDNEQLNFQVNRFIEPFHLDEKIQKKVIALCKKITNLEEWYTNWYQQGTQEYQEGNFSFASASFQLADFFLPSSDERKEITYRLFKETFYKSVADFNIEYTKMPYQGKELPVAIIKNPQAKNWLVFHGGFDSYLEELIRLSITYLSELRDYNILMFEGPGQGLAVKEGLYMTYDWEKPVSALLDYYQLDAVTLMGMSLGGYLSLRAASMEPRIHRVIAFDVFYSMMDAFTLKAPEELSNLPDLTVPEVQVAVDEKVNQLCKKNIDLNFKVSKAKEILGKKTPSEVLLEIQKFSLAGVEALIQQDVLLLAGTQDIYVPVSRVPFLQKEMINAYRIETVIFTNRSGGQFHCQVGAKMLAFKKIEDFLNEEVNYK